MGAGRRKIPDNIRKRILFDYIETQNMKLVADSYGVSTGTVWRIVRAEAGSDLEQKVAERREQQAADILAHMDSKKEQVCLLIDKYLEALCSDSKIASATVNQLSTALGTVIDKFTLNAQRAPNTTLFEAITREAAKLNDRN